MRQIAVCLVTVLCVFSFFMVQCYCEPLSSTIFGSHVGFSYVDANDVHEWETSSQLSSYIHNCSLLSSYTAHNWHGSDTTRDNIYTAASGAGAGFSITYFYGHGAIDYWQIPPFWVDPHWYVCASDGSKVYDCDIYPHSEPKNVKFAFLWSCHLGDTIGGSHLFTGPYGMPNAWLHTTDLSNDGYDDPDGQSSTFIGFKDSGPYLTKKLGEYPYAGYHFVAYFYQCAMQSGNTIIDALDYAAYEVWGVASFSQCLLYNGWGYGQMVVYGDGSAGIGLATTLPPDPPPPPERHRVPRCPTLFVWNGTDYVEEGLLDIHANSDITVQHRIQNTLALENHVYKLELRELDNNTSHIDQVKLYAVDYEGEWHLCSLIYAKHEDDYVTWKLLFDDEKRIDLTPTQVVNLKFLRSLSYGETAYFIFEINGYNMKIL